MDNKRIRLVFFSTWGSDYKQVELRISTFVGLFVGFVLSVMLLGMGLLYGSRLVINHFYYGYQQEKQSMLMRQFEQWKDRVENLSYRYERSQGRPGSMAITMFENRSDSTESLNGRGGAFVDEDDNILPALSATGGVPDGNLYHDSSIGEFSKGYKLLSSSDLIDQLEDRLSTSRQVHKVISEQFAKRRMELEHIPSIKPILRGRVTDFFGRRIDPFVRRIRHHRGIDIAAPRGTEVYSPAAGTVEFVKTRYQLNRGYGRVVIINHGYGMKTLYGHLWKVKVKPGQKIDRWDVLGLVGDTGRATGPHLHYEVWVDGKARDPGEFIINE